MAETALMSEISLMMERTVAYVRAMKAMLEILDDYDGGDGGCAWQALVMLVVHEMNEYGDPFDDMVVRLVADLRRNNGYREQATAAMVAEGAEQ